MGGPTDEIPMKPIRKFKVRPSLPLTLLPLLTIAHNLRWRINERAATGASSGSFPRDSYLRIQSSFFEGQELAVCLRPVISLVV